MKWIVAILTFVMCFYHFHRLESLKYRRLAINYDDINNYESSLKASLIGLGYNPFHTRLYGYVGHASLRLKRFKPAIRYLETMLKYYPYDLNAIIDLMFAYYYNGNLPKAFEMKDKLKQLKPSYVR